MKSILITGKNSYVGTNVEKWLQQYPDKYKVDTLDMLDQNWKDFDFSKYDVVFHVAGIAHIKETKKNRDLYFKVNRDLAVKTAIKAKESGVKQFIFLSSMSVYGVENGMISIKSIPKPKSAYGKSKYEAELALIELETDNFVVTILRPPMIYGPKSPGNYRKLSKMAIKLPFYPKIANMRSMLFIDNLAIFVKYYIDNNCGGLQLPQNDEYVNTTKLLTEIRNIHGKKPRDIRFLNIFVKLAVLISPIANKIFGSLFYSLVKSHEIELVDFSTSIRLTETSN